VTYDPARHAWSVTAHGPLPGRGKFPQVATGDVSSRKVLTVRVRPEVRQEAVNELPNWRRGEVPASPDRIGQVDFPV
jgi:hypothetical protein